MISCSNSKMGQSSGEQLTEWFESIHDDSGWLQADSHLSVIDEKLIFENVIGFKDFDIGRIPTINGLRPSTTLLSQ